MKSHRSEQWSLARSRLTHPLRRGLEQRANLVRIGRAINVPVVSIKKEEADAYYGPLAMFAGLDLPASSAKTQAELGWKPTKIGLIADIGQPDYFKG